MIDSTNIIATINTDAKADSYAIISPNLTGIDEAVQAGKVDVLEAGRKVVHHLLVFAHYPEMDRCLCEQLGVRLRGCYGDVVVSFIVRDEPGSSTVFIPAGQSEDSSLLSVSVAVAVIKRSWSWDESRWIEVGFEHTKEQIKVSPEYEEGKWLIGISPVEAA